jgi:carboxypeptidase Taq
MGLVRQTLVLRTAAGIVSWDMETKMPPRGLEQRSEQLGLMDLMAHKMTTDPRVPLLLGKIEKGRMLSKMTADQRRNVTLMRKSYDEAAKLPESLVSDTARQRILTIGAWKKAKAERRFELYSKELARMIELRKQAANILMDVKGTKTPYDALVDIYEPGMTADRITVAFSAMKDALMDIMRRVEAAGNEPNVTFLTRRVPVAEQRKISETAMDFIGFDTKGPNAGGRLDETEHPFTDGFYDDVRITTHYHEDHFTSSLFSVMHEGGHALYEQDLPQKWKWQPIGNACSHGVHESQSRYVENMVGRSPEFLTWMLPKLRRMTGGALKSVRGPDFVRAVNIVKPSKIRIDADEATYGLHIIIRFEMERDIFAGKLKVNELPEAWNEKYDRYLGQEIKNVSEGVAQDTHWAGGSFGYFPSYALGNIYGGMFLKKMNKAVPDWRDEIAKGNFAPVKNWLAENIHSLGNLYDPADLVKKVTGESLNIEPFIAYLNAKYERVNGI